MSTASFFIGNNTMAFGAPAPLFQPSYPSQFGVVNFVLTTPIYRFQMVSSGSVSVPTVGQLWPRGNRSNL
jgi:hypothetical protein